jgi:hypothetical protein
VGSACLLFAWGHATRSCLYVLWIKKYKSDALLHLLLITSDAIAKSGAGADPSAHTGAISEPNPQPSAHTGAISEPNPQPSAHTGANTQSNSNTCANTSANTQSHPYTHSHTSAYT